MTATTRLSNERIEDLTTLRLEKGLSNIVTLLEVNELENYMVNVNEAIERTTRGMNKYKVNGTAYNSYKEMTSSLEVLKKELQERMDISSTKEEVITEFEGFKLGDVFFTKSGKRSIQVVRIYKHDVLGMIFKCEHGNKSQCVKYASDLRKMTKQ